MGVQTEQPPPIPVDDNGKPPWNPSTQLDMPTPPRCLHPHPDAVAGDSHHEEWDLSVSPPPLPYEDYSREPDPEEGHRPDSPRRSAWHDDDIRPTRRRCHSRWAGTEGEGESFRNPPPMFRAARDPRPYEHGYAHMRHGFGPFAFPTSGSFGSGFHHTGTRANPRTPAGPPPGQPWTSFHHEARRGQSLRRSSVDSVVLREELGVGQGASQKEIRSAYLGLVRQYHPDSSVNVGSKHQAVAAEKFKEVTKAYESLSKRGNTG